jgi:hypothetical protein
VADIADADDAGYFLTLFGFEDVGKDGAGPADHFAHRVQGPGGRFGSADRNPRQMGVPAEAHQHPLFLAAVVRHNFNVLQFVAAPDGQFERFLGRAAIDLLARAFVGGYDIGDLFDPFATVQPGK